MIGAPMTETYLDGFFLGLAIAFLLSALILRLWLRSEAQALNEVHQQLWQINADVMCKNYGCGCLKLTQACIDRDKEVASLKERS